MTTARTSYGMFTPAGNKMVANMVNRAVRMPLTTTDKELYQFLGKRMDRIRRSEKGREVYDTDVRQQVIGEIERLTKRSLTIFF